jgi:type I restriction enzyme S subunit
MAPQNVHYFVGLDNIESHTGRILGKELLGPEKGGKHISSPGQVMYNGLRPALNKVLVTPFPLLSSLKQFVLIPVKPLAVELLGVLLRSDIVLNQACRSLKSLEMPNVNISDFFDFAVPDLRRVRNQGILIERAMALTQCMVTIKAAASKRLTLSTAILPAARNEVFTSML